MMELYKMEMKCREKELTECGAQSVDVRDKSLVTTWKEYVDITTIHGIKNSVDARGNVRYFSSCCARCLK